MKRIVIACAVLALTACSAPRGKYDWGSYEQSLYDYYKAPANVAGLMTSLDATIANAEKANRQVPPGIYAEYGYLLLQQGRNPEATAYFTKEKSRWPESTALMDRMIKLAEAKPAASKEVKQ